MEHAGKPTQAAVDHVIERLAQNVQQRTAEMLEALLPDDADPEYAAAVLSGMCGAIILELWNRAPGETKADREGLLVAWETIGSSIIDQLQVVEPGK